MVVPAQNHFDGHNNPAMTSDSSAPKEAVFVLSQDMARVIGSLKIMTSLAQGDQP